MISDFTSDLALHSVLHNSDEESESQVIQIVQSQRHSHSEDFFSIGLDAIAGVEWSFHKNMSLSAEYGIKFYYIS